MTKCSKNYNHAYSASDIIRSTSISGKKKRKSREKAETFKLLKRSANVTLNNLQTDMAVARESDLVLHPSFFLISVFMKRRKNILLSISLHNKSLC